MLTFLQKHPDKIYKPLLEHVQLVVITLLISVAIAVLFTVLSFAVSLYVLNKVLATCIVMIWNYWTKRRILTGGGARG